MSARTLALALSLGVLALAGCKSAELGESYRAHYTTTPPPGAVVPPYPAPQTVQPPLVIPQSK
jgi:hypothetical protein